jgi:hypothetical protein
MSQPAVRKGMPPRKLERPTFEQRFKSAFADPVFAPLQGELQAITDAAWDAYDDGRKAPVTRKAGPGFADPDYDIAIDWVNAHDAIEAAKRRHDDPAGPPRVLIVNGSSRTEAHLSRRNVEVLASGRDRPRDLQGARRIRSRNPRPQPHHIGVRQNNPSVQVMRVHVDGAVPLAMQLLPELFARAGARLDE